ncbi:hypothetical protein EON65_09350 [archaeon]|nr:MAG: hypothetical protein EON65_09350 [archaeon]
MYATLLQVTGYTVLHLAVIEERVDMIKYCLANGVNVCHKDKVCYVNTV